MSQLFADDDHVADPGLFSRGKRIPLQPNGAQFGAGLAPGRTPGPALMPGKGVRRIRCVGCRRETLPRNDDGAPLCQRCSELLASADTGLTAAGALTGQVIFRAPRWLRRRSTLG